MLLANVLCRSAAMPMAAKPLLTQFGSVGSACKQMALSGSIRSFKTNTNLMQNADRQFIRRAKERMGLKDRAMGPTSGAPFRIGQGAVAGASVFGLGALCYYGLGMSHAGQGAIDRSVMWPQYVKERIKTTYAYFGGSIVFTAAAAAAAFRSPAMMNLMMRNSWLVIGGSLAAMIGSGMVVRSLPYQEGFGAKQIGWMVHSGVVGVVLAPLCLVGGPILIRAAYMTAGIVGGLSAIAACAPSEQFLNMGGPLAIGLGVVFASSMGSMFLPATTALGAGIYSIALYGGLLLFSGMMLYDTQKIVKKAETNAHYDPVNESISLFMDTVNIFVRIVQMLAMNGNRRK